MVTIGRNITRLMRERKQTLPQIAIKAGIDKGNLSRIVQTGKGYSAKSLQAIADALDVPIAALFADEAQVELPSGVRRVPLLDEVRAGAFTSVAAHFPEETDLEYVLTSSNCSARSFALRVMGDSMVPDLNPGDQVVIDPEASPKPGNIVVAINAEGEASLKRYADRGTLQDGTKVFELIPSNPHYATLRSDQTSLQIVGVALQRITDLAKR